MADLTTTQLKLRTTPTAGVASEQSPYYRRLLSAGYKGFLQGTVGGSTLYGLMGLAVGASVALPLALVAGPAALAVIPAMGGLGVYKGATTFGNIGSIAAITAESAEMSEKRRYLLDRYYDLPDTPEYDAEAEQIRQLLARQHEHKPPQHMFHSRAVVVGALLGAAISLAFLTLPAAAGLVGGHFVFGGLAEIIGHGAAVGLLTAAGTALGALSGAMIGLDRYYVRSWLDKSAQAMHDTRTIEDQIREREREIEELTQHSPGKEQLLSKADPSSLKIHIAEPDKQSEHRAAVEHHARPEPLNPRQIAGLETPSTTASAIEHQSRVTLDRALQTPAV